MPKARGWPRGWQLPDSLAVQNMLMPHLRDWQGGQMARRGLEGGRSWNWLMYNNNLNTTSPRYYFELSYGEWMWSASSSFQSSTFSSTLFYLKVIEKPYIKFKWHTFLTKLCHYKIIRWLINDFTPILFSNIFLNLNFIFLTEIVM